MKTTEAEFLHVHEMIRDFPYLQPIAERLHLPDQAFATDSIEVVTAQLKKVMLSPTLHLLTPTKMREKFAFDGISRTVPDKADKTKWHVAIALQGPNHGLIVGALLTAYGHYIEDVASGKGYLKGPSAMRETSFDHAVHALEHACKWWGAGKENVRAINPAKLRSDADALVGVLNGLWLALATGIDPIYAKLQLFIASMQTNRNENAYVSMLVIKHLEQFACIFMDRGFYDHTIGAAGWQSEKEMCLNFDAATTRFFKSLQ
jgi:hypothetical protein